MVAQLANSLHSGMESVQCPFQAPSGPGRVRGAGRQERKVGDRCPEEPRQVVRVAEGDRPLVEYRPARTLDQ